FAGYIAFKIPRIDQASCTTVRLTGGGAGCAELRITLALAGGVQVGRASRLYSQWLTASATFCLYPDLTLRVCLNIDVATRFKPGLGMGDEAETSDRCEN